MIIKKTNIALILIIFVLLPSGCFFNTRENINSLKEKKFYFTGFKYILTGQSKDEAYTFYKKFPVKKILFLLAAEYNVTVDISDFSRFIKSRGVDSIESDGSFRIFSNLWKKQPDENNRIIITFEQDYLDSSIKKISITAYSGKSTVLTINRDVLNIDTVPDIIASALASGKKNLKEYNEKAYDNASAIPGIIDIAADEKISDDSAEAARIKSLIENYIKTLNQAQKNSFKHEMIDFIYQKCN